MFRKLSCLVTVAVLTAVSQSAQATTITFSGLAGPNGTPVTTYIEGGFTVTTTVGQFFQAQFFGNPIPSLFALSGQSAVDVTNGGALFELASVDLAGQNGDVNFAFTGFLGGVEQYELTGSRLGTASFGTVAVFGDIAIDDLRITLGTQGSSDNLDNIVLNAAAVPLPAALPLFATGLGALGLLGWRKKRKNAALAA
jgi:hypothetical protein